LDAVPVHAEFHQHQLGVLGRLRRTRRLERLVVELHRPAYDLERLAAVAGLDLGDRSEEHTSELQSLTNLVCRLLLEKKKYIPSTSSNPIVKTFNIHHYPAA